MQPQRDTTSRNKVHLCHMNFEDIVIPLAHISKSTVFFILIWCKSVRLRFADNSYFPSRYMSVTLADQNSEAIFGIHLAPRLSLTPALRRSGHISNNSPLLHTLKMNSLPPSSASRRCSMSNIPGAVPVTMPHVTTSPSLFSFQQPFDPTPATHSNTVSININMDSMISSPSSPPTTGTRFNLEADGETKRNHTFTFQPENPEMITEREAFYNAFPLLYWLCHLQALADAPINQSSLLRWKVYQYYQRFVGVLHISIFIYILITQSISNDQRLMYTLPVNLSYIGCFFWLKSILASGRVYRIYAIANQSESSHSNYQPQLSLEESARCNSRNDNETDEENEDDHFSQIDSSVSSFQSHMVHAHRCCVGIFIATNVILTFYWYSDGCNGQGQCMEYTVQLIFQTTVYDCAATTLYLVYVVCVIHKYQYKYYLAGIVEACRLQHLSHVNVEAMIQSWKRLRCYLFKTSQQWQNCVCFMIIVPVTSFMGIMFTATVWSGSLVAFLKSNPLLCVGYVLLIVSHVLQTLIFVWSISSVHSGNCVTVSML